MSNPPHIGAAALPCLRCGYDLRATATVDGKRRCPECGTLASAWGAGGLTASRIPWLHRHRRGRVRMFIASLWMALAVPWRLAAETRTSARLRDARRFRIIILVLSTLVGAAFLEYAMNHWDDSGWWLLPEWEVPLLFPTSMLIDRWFGVLPLAVGVYAANAACVDLYRWIIWLGARPRFMKRRLRAISCYASSIMLLEMILAGIVWGCWRDWFNHFSRDTNDITLMLPLAGIAVALYLLASLGLVLRSGRLRAVRAMLVLIYPAVAFVLWNMILMTINWAVSYVVLGVRSMGM